MGPSFPPPPPGAEPEPVLPAAPDERRGSIAKVILALAALSLAIGGVVAAAVLWLGAPGPCAESTVESARFGYCVAAPGWEYTNDGQDAELPYDELVRSDETTVRIVAIQLEAGQDLGAVVDAVRSIESEDGIEPGEVVDRRVAGVRAAQWDISLGEGTIAQQIREVIFVRGSTAWRVQLLADAEAFANRVPQFDAILRSWIFR